MSDTTSAPVVQAVPSGLEWARYAASHGWPVFPLVAGRGIPFAVETMNAALGLAADAPAGVRHATTDPAMIERMWSDDRASAWIGVAMGSGRMAIDLDEKRGKSGTATLSANGWTIPPTATQRTRSGGWHCLVDVPAGSIAPNDSDQLGSGVDRRGDGGFVILYDPAILTAARAAAPEWSLGKARSDGDGGRIAPGTGKRAPSYEIALEALRRCDPTDESRNQWLLLSGSFHAATVGLVDDAQALADWQAWQASYPGNDVAANARTWSGFARSGTDGDWSKLAQLSRDPWHFFRGEAVSVPVEHRSRPTNDAAALFVRVADMEARPPVFVVDGLVEEDAFAVLFGDPASGKSLIAIDMAASIATAHPFHGHAVRAGAVFYIAGEGKNGLRRRFAAWEHLNGQSLDDAPLYASRTAVQFLDGESAAMVTAAIEGLADRHGPPRLIVVDTLARNFGAGDENSQKDMNGFVAALDRLRERFPGSTVLLVHHSGHGDKERARGSSVLRGAVDAEYKVAKDGEAVHLSNLKMKDAAPPPAMAFDLIEAAGSVALEYTGEPSERCGKPTAIQSMTLEAFNAVAEDDRATLEAWRSAFYERHTGNDAAKRKAFERGRKWMIETGNIRSNNDGARFERAPMPGIVSRG